jgi:hypothetical protein
MSFFGVIEFELGFVKVPAPANLKYHLDKGHPFELSFSSSGGQGLSSAARSIFLQKTPYCRTMTPACCNRWGFFVTD